jgi:hypothetical protein
MTPNETLAEQLRRRQLYLLRHQVSVRNEVNRYLAILGRDITAAITTIAPGEPTREVYRRQRVDKLISAVADTITTAYRQIRDYDIDEMAALADAEALYLVQAVNALGAKAALDLSAREAVALVKDALIAGAPMADWWAGQARDIRERFAQEMRMGIIGGEGDADLIRRVRGTAQLGYTDGIMEVSRRMARILVRGASSATIGAVRSKAVLDNPRVFSGVQQISVLDGRTSQTCISYAGKVWEVPGYKPVGHSLPYNGGTPRHPNCRSTEIPVLRDGEPAEDMGFDTFIKDKPKSLLDELLGKGRADLYRDGKITLSDLVDQNGRPLTVAQLRALTT